MSEATVRPSEGRLPGTGGEGHTSARAGRMRSSSFIPITGSPDRFLAPSTRSLSIHNAVAHPQDQGPEQEPGPYSDQSPQGYRRHRVPFDSYRSPTATRRSARRDSGRPVIRAPSAPRSSGAEALLEPVGHELKVAGREVGFVVGPPRLGALPCFPRPAGRRCPQAVIRPGEDLHRDVTISGQFQPTPDDRQALLGRQRSILLAVDDQDRAPYRMALS